MPEQAPKEQRHSVVTNLLFNIVIPTLILTKLSSAQYLGPHYSIVIALAFPIAFGIYDFAKMGKANLFSILGFVSILLTGGISLLELDAKYIAIKEAAIPGLIGIAVLVSQYTRFPLIRKLMLNEEFIDLERVNTALALRQTQSEFDQAIVKSTYLVAMSFFLSSALNYGLAKYILISPPGTEAYSAELGKMTGLSFPVIALPCTLFMMGALFYLVNRIKKLTGLEMDEVFRVK